MAKSLLTLATTVKVGSHVHQLSFPLSTTSNMVAAQFTDIERPLLKITNVLPDRFFDKKGFHSERRKIVELTGAEIILVLEQAATNAFGATDAEGFPYAGSTGAYPYSAGLRYTVTAGAPAGSVITDVEINSRVAGEWTPIILDETYTIVTNSFISAGRDGYLVFGEVDSSLVTDTYQEYAQSFIDYAKAATVINDLPLEEYSTKAFSVA